MINLYIKFLSSNLIIILKNIFVNRRVRIMKYIIGLDIGIGSVGWAVVRNEDDCKRLEDFGVRIFESGEIIESNKWTIVNKVDRKNRKIK